MNLNNIARLNNR